MILAQVGPDKPKAVMATVITSYALSSILTGIIFLFLGLLRLGDLVSFFPRSILLGCIGGVGVFLVLTGMEVSAGLDSNIGWNLNTLQSLMYPTTLVLWTLPLLLSILLMLIRKYLTHPVVMPAFFILIIIIFYVVYSLLPNISLQDLQDNGWVFAAPDEGVPFYHFYAYYGMRYRSVVPSLHMCLHSHRFSRRQLESNHTDNSNHVCLVILWHNSRPYQCPSSRSGCARRRCQY